MILAAPNREFVTRPQENVSASRAMEGTDVIPAFWDIMVIPNANLVIAAKLVHMVPPAAHLENVPASRITREGLAINVVRGTSAIQNANVSIVIFTNI